MSEAVGYGISRYSLYKMRDDGVIEQILRGVYRLIAASIYSPAFEKYFSDGTRL